MRILIAIIIVCAQIIAAQRMKDNEIDAQPIKVVEHAHGEDVLLKCKDHDQRKKSTHRWRFAQCVNCNRLTAADLKWKDLQPKHKRIHLKNITAARDAGRYICMTHDDIVVAAYELQITGTNPAPPPTSLLGGGGNSDAKFTFIARPPEIVDVKMSDAPIRAHASVVVKCEVVSPLAPRIWWLRECIPSAHQRCDLVYDGRYYYKLNGSAHDLFQPAANVYVSKLHVRNFTRHDSGLYVCVTLTELGKDYRNFTLDLPAASAAAAGGDYPTSTLNFLFFVPFVFILIPVCIDCVGKRIGGARKSKQQEVELLEVVRAPPPPPPQPSMMTTRIYHC